MLKNYSKVEVDEDGAKRYFNDEGKYHRLDGLAVEFKVGSKFWRINGSFHRNIDPSVEFYNGEKLWRFKNKRHRIGGSFYCSHRDYWCINDKEYTKQEYYDIAWSI